MPKRPKSPPPTPPQSDDPLAEELLHRRVWSAYLHRGYTRADFARHLGVPYSVVDRWDRHETDISLSLLAAVARATGFTLDQLYYGRRALTKDEVDELTDLSRRHAVLAQDFQRHSDELAALSRRFAIRICRSRSSK